MGIFVPPIADAVRPWVGYCIAILLFLAALRIKPAEALGKLSDLRGVLLFIAIFQVALPCLLAVIFLLTDTVNPIYVALLLVFSSAPISASPSLTMITGNDPAPSLRLLIVATALLPLTILLPLWLMPAFGDPEMIVWIAAKLFFIIFAASMLAFAIRRFFVPEISKPKVKSIDGLTTIMMAVIVTGLMTGFGDAAINRPFEIVVTLCVAFAANIGMQIITWHGLGFFKIGKSRAAYSISAGNRNLAIFLAALPLSVTDPILLFIACYQIPMYLTPTLLGSLYGHKK
ncbi:MAG: hypothetical protein ABJN04_11680 [Hyphomicrobiales bacterium]